MPEWLLQKDTYIPPKDRDAFINKSILSILGVLTKLKLQTGHSSKWPLVNPFIKIISAMLLIILTALSRSFVFVMIVDIYLLLFISLLNSKEIKYILKMGIIISMFSLVILTPSIFMGNKNNSFLIVIKVLTSATALNILSCTTSWNDITSSLKLLYIPDIFILVLDITMKYILILGEFSLNMLYALKLRSIGKSIYKNESLSGIVGTMFIKSKDMADEMYGAMECRGFTGEYKVQKKFKFNIIDVFPAIINIIFIFAYFYFDRL